jgi:hypothetical protein
VTRVRFDLETIGPDRRLRVTTASVDVPAGSQLGRLSLSVEGLVLAAVPLSPWWDRLAAEPDDDEDQADDLDEPGPLEAEYLAHGEAPRHGAYGLTIPRGQCGYYWADGGGQHMCRLPEGHPSEVEHRS